jgi:hypothetical protein
MTFKRFTKSFVGKEGVTSNLMKKIVETALEERGDYSQHQREQLSLSMLHSYETVKSYYLVKDSLVTNQQSLEMYKEFKKMTGENPKKKSTKRKKKTKTNENGNRLQRATH